MPKYTDAMCEELISTLGRCTQRESDLADILHEMTGILNREGARITPDGIDRCRSCDANMEVPVPEQQHHANCEIGLILERAILYYAKTDRIRDTSIWLQAMEYRASNENSTSC
jgi:hypothetical protein